MLNHLRVSASVIGYVWNHPANRGHRSAAVARSVAFQVRGRSGQRTRTRIGTSTEMWAVLHRTASSRVVYGNPPDYPEMMAWRQMLRPGDLFIDVGANVGIYALWASDCGATVIAVEPAAETADLLRENVALNPHASVEVHQCALADERGEMWLSEGLDATNYLLVDGDHGERVEVYPLDDILGDRTAAGMKIDVEGAERLVLEGASRALKEGRIRVLQLEWNHTSQQTLGEDREPVAALLRGYGYSFARPDQSGLLVPTDDLSMGPADLFALAS